MYVCGQLVLFICFKKLDVSASIVADFVSAQINQNLLNTSTFPTFSNLLSASKFFCCLLLTVTSPNVQRAKRANYGKVSGKTVLQNCVTGHDH